MTDKLVERLRKIPLYEGHGEPSSLPEDAADALEAQQARIVELEKMDSDAAKHVVSVICMRTGFTGEPPYVGWQGLGLALSEGLDERDALRARTHALEEALGPLAGEADNQCDSDDDDQFEDWDGNRVSFTVGDLRRAKHALEGKE